MRTFKPDNKYGTTNQFILWLSRTEILLGSGLLVVGGFYSRASGDYLMVSVGSVLLLLGCWHLYRDVKPPVSERQYQTDRVFLRLKDQLPEGYTLAFDLPVGDDVIDYLVVGDAGVFAMRRLDVRGTIRGSRESDTWEVDPPNDENVQTLRNPIKDNEPVVREIRERLENQLDDVPPVHSLVVVTRGDVEVDEVDSDAPRRIGEIGTYILDRETGETLGLERQRSIERALGLPSY